LSVTSYQLPAPFHAVNVDLVLSVFGELAREFPETLVAPPHVVRNKLHPSVRDLYGARLPPEHPSLRQRRRDLQSVADDLSLGRSARLPIVYSDSPILKTVTRTFNKHVCFNLNPCAISHTVNEHPQYPRTLCTSQLSVFFKA